MTSPANLIMTCAVVAVLFRWWRHCNLCIAASCCIVVQRAAASRQQTVAANGMFLEGSHDICYKIERGRLLPGCSRRRLPQRREQTTIATEKEADDDCYREGSRRRLQQKRKQMACCWIGAYNKPYTERNICLRLDEQKQATGIESAKKQWMLQSETTRQNM